MPQDFEQSLANAFDTEGNISDANVMDLLADAMTTGESWAQSQQDGVPTADATTIDPPAPAATPAPAPAAPAPAPATPSPAPAAADPTDPDAVPPGTTPVIQAKDGIHTISYDKLVEARETAAAAKAEAARLATELAEARAKAATPAPAPAAPAAAPAPAADPDAPLFGDYTDADLKKGVQTLLDQQAATLRAEFEGKLQPVEVERKVAAQSAHLNTILTAHPDAVSIVESQEFAAWKASQPTIVRNSIEAVQDTGSAADMVEVLGMYRAAHPRQAAQAPAAPAAAPAAPAAAPTAEALASKAIAAASTRTPTTLSDIPAGSQAVVDEAAAFEQMSPRDLMDKMLSMSPEQIEAYQARFV